MKVCLGSMLLLKKHSAHNEQDKTHNEVNVVVLLCIAHCSIDMSATAKSHLLLQLAL